MDSHINEHRIAELEKRIEELQRIVRSVSNDKKKYREMVESANSIIITVDKQGRLTFISQDTINDCPFEKMLNTGKREMTEVSLKDESVWLQVIVDPVTDDDGRITGAVHIVQDITAQKNIEKSLKESTN